MARKRGKRRVGPIETKVIGVTPKSQALCAQLFNNYNVAVQKLNDAAARGLGTKPLIAAYNSKAAEVAAALSRLHANGCI